MGDDVIPMLYPMIMINVVLSSIMLAVAQLSNFPVTPDDNKVLTLARAKTTIGT